MLSLEPLLRERLERSGLFKGVWGLADLNAEKTKPTPCVYVIYDGARVIESPAPYDKARVAVRWLVVLAVKDVARAADGNAARAAAQPLLAAIFNLLLGWRPDRAHMELRLTDCPRPEYQSGLLWLPAVFETVQILKGD
jgi:hypothetical protein